MGWLLVEVVGGGAQGSGEVRGRWSSNTVMPDTHSGGQSKSCQTGKFIGHIIMGGRLPTPKHDKLESNMALCVLVMEHERGTATMECTLHQGRCPTSRPTSHQWSHIGCKQRSAAKGSNQWRDWFTNPNFGMSNTVRGCCGHPHPQWSVDIPRDKPLGVGSVSVPGRGGGGGGVEVVGGGGCHVAISTSVTGKGNSQKDPQTCRQQCPWQGGGGLQMWGSKIKLKIFGFLGKGTKFLKQSILKRQTILRCSLVEKRHAAIQK